MKTKVKEAERTTGAPAVEMSVEERLNWYKHWCRQLRTQVWELQRENERIARKSYRHKANIRSMQKALREARLALEVKRLSEDLANAHAAMKEAIMGDISREAQRAKRTV